MADDSTRDLRAWALKGAEQRLVEIAAEAAAIHRTFPELRDRASGLTGATSRAAAVPSQPKRARRKGRRRTLSAEGRSRIAEAARKRWAEWKARQGQAAEASAPASSSKGRAPKKR
jgi:hypothetical protein